MSFWGPHLTLLQRAGTGRTCCERGLQGYAGVRGTTGEERHARSVTTSEPGNNEVSQHPDTALASRPAGLADKQLGDEADA